MREDPGKPSKRVKSPALIAKPAITRELILARPADRQASIATTAISDLIRTEIVSLVDDGLWNIRI